MGELNEKKILILVTCYVIRQLKDQVSCYYTLSLTVAVTRSRLPDVGAGEAQHLRHVADPARVLGYRYSRL